MASYYNLVLANEADTTATRTSGGFFSHGRGLRLRLVTANKTGTTATYTLSVQQEFAANSWVTIWSAAAAVTAAATSVYVLYPAGGTAGAQTEAVQIPVSGTWRVVLTVASADGDNNMDTQVDAVDLD